MKSPHTIRDRKKIIRSILQGFVLLALLAILLNKILIFSKYEHYGQVYGKGDSDNAFIALSYFAVDRDGSDTMISTDRLEEHLQALSKNGFITLTQEDIRDYYKENKEIPKRSMFLMFEDGRRDTAIFSSPILERYNYIATVLSYGNKFQEKDPKFLNPRDLKHLERSTFWEMGTNGYRLAYINVFDRYDNYLGQLHPTEFTSLRQYIDRNYNHYLMDFIRDKNHIPKESYQEMKRRIQEDYKLMEDVYTQELGSLPKTYVLMHSNTGQFASNRNVSKVNEDLIKKYFSMNFNREGFALNDRKSSIYDLTRIQPQAYWYPNHLLMKIQKDTGEDLTFIDGDETIKKDWELIKGAAEFRQASIIITSQAEDEGLIRLDREDEYKNIEIHTRLRGNLLGEQGLYLRADDSLREFIFVGIVNNVLYVQEGKNEIFSINLDEYDGIKYQTVKENKLEAMDEAYKIYNKNSKRRRNPTQMENQDKVTFDEIDRIEENANLYIPEIQINEPGNRDVSLYLKDDRLSIYIDKDLLVEDLSISKASPGSIYLKAGWGGGGYSQRNLSDTIYDGVFEDLVIRDLDDGGQTIYINKLEGTDLIINRISKRWNRIINWFIKNL